MESLVQDYRTMNGVSTLHMEVGRHTVSLFRFEEIRAENHTRTWIDEVDFNIKGLTMDCFLPPAELKREDEGCPRVLQPLFLPRWLPLRKNVIIMVTSNIFLLVQFFVHRLTT